MIREVFKMPRASSAHSLKRLRDELYATKTAITLIFLCKFCKQKILPFFIISYREKLSGTKASNRYLYFSQKIEYRYITT